jgi:hypothetical protein
MRRADKYCWFDIPASEEVGVERQFSSPMPHGSRPLSAWIRTRLELTVCSKLLDLSGFEGGENETTRRWGAVRETEQNEK